MVFHTDRQRKAVMAKLKGSSRSNTNPNFLGKIKGKLRKKFRPTSQELAEQRGARLQKEAQALEEEKRTARQLELEAKLEVEREIVRARSREARAKLSAIDAERFSRTKAGQAVSLARKGIKAGVARGREALAEAQKAPRRKRKKKSSNGGVSPFGID